MVECQPSKLAPADTSTCKPTTSDSASTNDNSRDSNAIAASPVDLDLQRVINAWPELPAAIQAGIMAMVQAADRLKG
jgi:hypothetical protein